MLSSQITISYSECIDEKDVEKLKFLLSQLETEVVMKSWDLNVTASIGNAEIQDYFTKSERDKYVGETCLFMAREFVI